jgi:hypothetical protein
MVHRTCRSVQAFTVTLNFYITLENWECIVSGEAASLWSLITCIRIIRLILGFCRSLYI